jgi:hypothetical protein
MNISVTGTEAGSLSIPLHIFRGPAHKFQPGLEHKKADSKTLRSLSDENTECYKIQRQALELHLDRVNYVHINPVP